MQTPADEQIEALLTESLSRLHILHCENSLQLLATVHSLPHLLTSVPDTKVVLVDSISSFYWVDRMESQVRDEQEYSQRQFVYAMKNILQTFRLVLFATKPLYFAPHPSAGGGDQGEAVPFGLMHREHMSQTWTRFVRYRFITSKLPTPTGTSALLGGGSGGVGKQKFIGKILQPPGKRIHYFSIPDL